MTMLRYEPWSLLNQLQKQLESSYDEKGSEGSISTAEWAPAVDIKEEDNRFVLYADIPGVKPENIEVHMDSGVLTVKGEKESVTKTEKDGYKRIERSSGSFYRRFNLPDTANDDAISAHSIDGVLEIIIPKREAVKPKKINVSS